MIDQVMIGRRIAEERKLTLGISQEKMVEKMYEKLGVSWNQPDLSNMEHGGTAVLNLQKLDILARFFNIPLQNLIFGADMPSKMIHYYGKKMTLTKVSNTYDLNKERVKVLENLLGKAIATVDRLGCFTCGPYTTYILGELHTISALSDGLEVADGMKELSLRKLKLFVFFEDKVIGTLWVAVPTIFMLMNLSLINGLTRMIPRNVLDVTDPARWLNPFLVFRQFFILPSEREQAEKDACERIAQLQPININPAFLVESVYVREECRRMGICRLMFDVLESAFGKHLTWLNMEPTDGTELDNSYQYYPEYTQAEIGQLNINAAIAERLGFTIDPDLWHREMTITTDQGKQITKAVEVRKCAFKIPDYIKIIIGDTSDLVTKGRILQKDYADMMEQVKQEHPELLGDYKNANEIQASDAIDCIPAMKYGACILEFTIPIRGGVKRYAVGVMPKHGEKWYAVAEKSFIKYGLDIDVLERRNNPEEASAEIYKNYFKFASIALNQLPNSLSPAKKAEWDSL